MKEHDLNSPDYAHHRGLRTVATFEAFKGTLGLAAAIAIVSIAHKDISDIAERILGALHLNPDSRFGTFIMDKADRTTPHILLLVALGGVVYAAVRFIEAYGLWHLREWAEWFALLSGLMYLPWELTALIRHPGPLKWGILLVNVGVVLYMGAIRWESYKRNKRVART